MNQRLERAIKFVLDECLPPIVRDRRWVMWLPFKVAFKDKARFFFEFKDRAADMSPEEFHDVYANTSAVQIQQEGTDLSPGAIEAIERNIAGETVLDVGCGKGVLAGVLSERFRVAACDILIDETATRRAPKVDFRQAAIEALPYGDGEFDTVVCAHTLEHILEASRAIAELRRVARRRLIAVLPKERPYRHTFNLHLRFFPYRVSVFGLFQPKSAGAKADVREIEGCWYYQEEMEQ